jgi:uncharacterized protein (DUF885 family)
MQLKKILLGCMLSLTLNACPKKTEVTSVKTSTPNSAIAGVESPLLQDLLGRYWDWQMKTSPTWATSLSDHRYDNELGDNSLTGIEADKKSRRQWLKEAKSIDQGTLKKQDKITLQMLIEEIENNIASEVCSFQEWSVSSQDNPVQQWNYLPELHQVDTTADGANLLARYKKISGWIDNDIANLTRGADKGLYANAESVKRAIKMIEKQLADPLDEWPLMEPTKKEHKGWSEKDLSLFRTDLRIEVEANIKPALARYLSLLQTKILPHARDEAHSGLSALPNGQQCYEARIRAETTLKKTAQELHDLGMSEIKKINGEMSVLGEKLFQSKDLAVIIEKLRSDKTLFFSSPEEIQKKAESTLAAAKAKIPNYFGALPKADCVVRPIPDYEAPYTTTAYYRQPAPDGSKPGEYFVNIYDPASRPKFEAQVLAFHESIPGHHLQIAIAQELPEFPDFRKHTGPNAFVEGWALYTERLADEMGLYSSDLDRMGMLSYDAWRASRLVVDTGLHALGWTREQAVQFMLTHTALSELNIRNEVDRYLVWPAQALSYKSGQLEFWRLRRLAEKELGDKFDIKGFHDTVLQSGAVSLSIVEQLVLDWIKSKK